MDLNELERKLDNSLSKETPETLNNWIDSKRENKILTAVILSNTQIRILEFFIMGKKRQEIAEKMKIKKNTLESYIRDMVYQNQCNLAQLIWRYAHTKEGGNDRCKYDLHIFTSTSLANARKSKNK